MPERRQAVPSVREAILEVLHDEARPLRVAEIIDMIKRLGVQVEDDTVRSIVVKLLKAGHLRRPGHGVYALPHQVSSDPQDAESPAGTGLSDREACSGSSLASEPS